MQKLMKVLDKVINFYVKEERNKDDEELGQK